MELNQKTKPIKEKKNETQQREIDLDEIMKELPAERREELERRDSMKAIVKIQKK